LRMIAGSVLPGWAESCEDTSLIVPYRYPSAKRDGGLGYMAYGRPTQ
jgi:hypothetical protein